MKGREIVHSDLAFDRIKSIIEELKDVGKIVMPPKLNGRQVETLLTSIT